ncbi:hypothetical protein PG985_006756 [Apiospora marii]|uniref:Uncharacterized protein n=1 Tax=Apiospora marii TaxID=335849 RepID=A0ABR1SIC8_9PEZI
MNKGTAPSHHTPQPPPAYEDVLRVSNAASSEAAAGSRLPQLTRHPEKKTGLSRAVDDNPLAALTEAAREAIYAGAMEGVRDMRREYERGRGSAGDGEKV